MENNNKIWLETAEKLYEIQQLKLHYSAQARELQELLKALSNFTSYTYLNFKFIKSSRIGSIDYKRIENTTNINLNDYRRPESECWKLTNMKEKMAVLNKTFRKHNAEIKEEPKKINLYNSIRATQTVKDDSCV